MVEVYIDGASAGDPGPSGAGIFIKDGIAAESHSIPLGVLNNHEAEFMALIKALEICLERGHSVISVRSDSSAVVGAVEKNFARKDKYARYLQEINRLSGQFDLFFIKWIPSKQNKAADQLARKGIRP
ncbi:MAG TPA: reverse transcriptase-like protein [Bacillaceae bacterium]